MSLLGGVAEISENDLIVDDTGLAPGYGQLNDEVMEAINLSARQEALLLDPVYTGRTMAGLISLVRRGVIEPNQSTLFIHTGGLPALFAYETKLTEFAGW